MKRVFVVTGVCQVGTEITLPMVDFLANADDYVLAWIDLKDETGRVAFETPTPTDRVVLARAPRAIWGGASIVRSMMEAVVYALAAWSDWEQIIFCSMDDVPLASRDTMGTQLDAMARYDYCGSRWNNSAYDVLKPIPEQLLLPSGIEMPQIEFPIRPEMSLWLDPALQPVFTDDLIRSRRLCDHLYERYFVAASEWFRPGALSLGLLTPERAAERSRFFEQYGLYCGRQWCMLSRKFAEIAVGEQSRQIFKRWFSDLLIPDECFFQTIAHHNAAAGAIEVLWTNFYYHDAGNFAVTPEKLLEILDSKTPSELFARKRVHWLTFETINAVLDSR